MLTTEISPLINANQKNDHKKSRLARYISILILFVISAFAVYYYSISGLPSDSQSENKLFLPNPKDYKPEWYPTQQELDEYRSKTVFIEYDIEDAPKTDDYESNEMRIFHNNLIKQHGYNSHYHNINFIVADAIAKRGGGGSEDLGQTELSCKTMYILSDQEGFMELNCGDYFQERQQLKITGCVSYEADTDGVRHGEQAYDSSECSTSAVGSGLTMLAGRCCRGTTKKGLITSYDTISNTDGNFCPEVFCADYTNGETAMGCTGFTSDATDTFSGVKRTEHDITATVSKTGCKAQRSSSGELFIAPYCGKVMHGAIKCKTFYDTEPTKLVNKGMFKSIAVCEDDPQNAWTITDCDSVVQAEINQCNANAISFEGDKGFTYGAYFARQRCVAMGNTENIFAVATCCVIENKKLEYSINLVTLPITN